ncbi:pyruvate formate-lyase-activating protein [Segatella albensis]|uniref:pyruvate formate-lyase-activating protein n=1 Tax=Segatella albensis TaxID=77768 RepID=UPI00041DA21B|nr:pyruvate formate-lyase-activating protein [Segatella albensis]
MTKGYIHSIESFGSVDGPGIRFLIFLQGCPMRCQFCHNPDSWAVSKQQEMTAEELLDKAERFRSYWGDKGGITVSGGEALLQIDFLLELFTKAHERGINTCLDTSAQPFRRHGEWFDKFEALMQVTDTILLDIKHIRDDEHRKITCCSNQNILDCARYLSDIRKPVWIRHVLVPSITDKDEYLHELADFLSTLQNIERIDVLPYHTLGIFKYEKLGIPYPLDGVEPPTKERIENAKTILGAK